MAEASGRLSEAMLQHQEFGNTSWPLFLSSELGRERRVRAGQTVPVSGGSDLPLKRSSVFGARRPILSGVLLAVERKRPALAVLRFRTTLTLAVEAGRAEGRLFCRKSGRAGPEFRVPSRLLEAVCCRLLPKVLGFGRAES